MAQLRLTQSPTLRKGTTVKAEDDGDNDIEVENDDLPSVLRPATMRPLSFIRYPNLKFQECVGFFTKQGFSGFSFPCHLLHVPSGLQPPIFMLGKNTISGIITCRKRLIRKIWSREAQVWSRGAYFLRQTRRKFCGLALAYYPYDFVTSHSVTHMEYIFQIQIRADLNLIFFQFFSSMSFI